MRNEVFRREEIEKLAGEKTAALTELEQRNKNLRALQKISDIVLNESEMKLMTQKILDELPKQLDNCIGGFLSIVRKGELMAYALTTNHFNDKIYHAIGTDLEKYSFPIKKDFNRLHTALVTKASLDSDSLADFISPPIAKPVAMTLQKIIGAKHMEAFPLYAGGAPFGVLLFVFSASRDQIHGKNFEIAKSVADEMSLAVQRAEAFQQLKDANEYLSQLDKMKDEFISMASHELNTPLAAIEGYLSMILDEHMGGKIDAKTKEYLSRAYASSKRLAELILDLLNVSRIEQGRLKMKFVQVNLADLAESVIHELQIKADAKKIYLKVEADKGKIPLTWCDPDRIREVFVNLAGNAIKFTEKGGVTIKIAKGEGNTIVGSVTDTGRGIAKEDQKKLFQKFSQIHREVDEHQGTGLGLYISKNFVELHKGRLSVESDAGQGATFSFELPIVTEAPKQIEGAILDGPLSAPKVVAATGKEVPAIITASSKQTS
ncbi:MAG TPA: GAF domain-containing sensor histidine kinase [Candidatus Saccharimonadales bacterium]|nr:GAF domain-containing sensor histidine kinase [Candidatus Saccharimonadales bacterium]